VPALPPFTEPPVLVADCPLGPLPQPASNNNEKHAPPNATFLMNTR